VRLKTVGPSGVRALPLAAGINVGGHYKWNFFLFLSLLRLIAPCTMQFLGGKGGYFEKFYKGSITKDMTLEGLGEVFKGDSADGERGTHRRAQKFSN
jgi:hypothetical protein